MSNSVNTNLNPLEKVPFGSKVKINGRVGQIIRKDDSGVLIGRFDFEHASEKDRKFSLAVQVEVIEYPEWKHLTPNGEWV